jgi:GTPase SAR1 family protein
MISLLTLLLVNVHAQQNSTNPDAIQHKRFKRAYQTLLNSMQIFDKVAGRDIILILGQSQVGKSTTINALRGVKFQWEKPQNESAKPELIPILPLPEIKLAPMGRGVQRTTEKPDIYEGIPGFLIVDSRGVGELGEDPTGKLAASALMEMLCQAAKSIRIVALVSFSQIGQIPNLGPLMEQIGNLLPDASSDIFWLINRHYLNRAGSPSLTEQSEEQILKEVQAEIESVWNQVKDVKIPTKDSAPTSIRLDQKTTIAAIRKAFEARPSRVAYIDLTSESSVGRISKAIKEIAQIPFSKMKFGMNNPARGLFNDYLRKRFQREIKFFFKYLRFRLSDIPSILRGWMG